MSQSTDEITRTVREGKDFERNLEALSGQAWCVGDGVSTDLIAPGRYFDLRSNLDTLAEHTLEDATLETTDARFMEVMTPGDFVVGGRNFGQGSSREHAPAIMERVGVSAVIAESTARIFYRNAVNVGLPIITCDTSQIEEGNELHVDLLDGVLVNRTTGDELVIDPLPSVMMQILRDSGLKAHVQTHGALELD